MSSDLTFITNEPGKHLRERFGVLLGDETRLFDCLVGYFLISGFHKLYPALTKAARADVSTSEREIDELVFALYGLTPEEIKIV